MAEIPQDLHYTKEHEWLRKQGDVYQVGVTAFAVEQLGDVTMVELPNEGESFDQEQIFGTVESVKAVSDLFSPLSGKILRVNSPLADTPEYVNQDPYDEGWMVDIELSTPAQLEGLMDREAYKIFLADQDS